MRRTILLLLTLFLSLNTLAQPAAPDSVPQRKKVAVVLSGGGAFGAIHVGALKVIEEAGIPVDMVVGTSMGSIVGALYSVGYDSDDIATMFRTTDWADLFLDREDQRHGTLGERDALNTYLYERDFYVGESIDPQPGGVIRGTNVENAFERYLHGYTDSIDFLRDLPRQFACVATDLVTDSAEVLTRGSLVKSIRSSMSIPGVFTPVHMGDKVLVDGGSKNNFAADVARQLGADIVIGVKFHRGLGADKGYRRLMDVLERSAGSDVSRRSRENEKYCDLVVRVPVRGYTSGSFTKGALDSLMARGEKAMRAKMDSLLVLKERAGAARERDYSMHLREIEDVANIDDAPAGLVDTRVPSTLNASVGLRFDTEDIAAAQFNARYFPGEKLNKELNLTVRLGLRSMLRLGFDLEPWLFKKIGMSYEFWYKRFDLHTRGHRSDNLSLIYQNANVKLLQIDAMNFDCELGLGWEHYHHFNTMKNEYSTMVFDRNEHYFNYHAALRYNNEDNRYFPRRGVRAEARYEYYTDNFVEWKGHSGFGSLMARFQATIPLSRTTYLRPSVYGRLLFGDDIPDMKLNTAGGMSYGKFFPQQLPMAGMGQVEIFENNFLGASLRLQQRITGKHFLVLDGSVAEHNDTLGDIFERSPMWGAQIGYFFDSGIAGPLGATLGWNSHTHRVNFFVTLGFEF